MLQTNTWENAVWRQTQWEDGFVEMEADIGVRLPPAKECLGAQKLEETRKDPFRAWRKYGLTNTMMSYC